MTQEEMTLIDQWNDTMFVSSDAAAEGWYEGQDQYAAEEEQYYDAYEEDPRWGWRGERVMKKDKEPAPSSVINTHTHIHTYTTKRPKEENCFGYGFKLHILHE